MVLVLHAVVDRDVGSRQHREAAHLHRSARVAASRLLRLLRLLDAEQGSLNVGRGAAAIRKVPAEAAEPPAVLKHGGRVVLTWLGKG